MATFTEAQAAFGFFGYYDLLTDAGQRHWQDTRATWTGYMTGTSATMTCSAGGSNPYWVSIDGGAETNPTISGGTITLFTGLSDAPHLVRIRADGAYSPTFNSTPTSGTLFTVTGSAAAIGQGSDLGTAHIVTNPGAPLQSSLGTYPTFGGNITPTYPLVLDPEDYQGGQVVFSAKCSCIWVYGGDSTYSYIIGTGQPVQVTVGLSDGLHHWRKIVSGLDPLNFHTYRIMAAQVSGSESFLGVMIGDSTAVFDTAPNLQRIDQFGDSITSAGVLTGVTNDEVGIYRAAAVDGFIGAAIGKSGQTSSGLHTDLTTSSGPNGASIIASRPGVAGAWALLAIGRNDATPIPAAYTTCINDLLSAGYAKVICRGIEPLNAGVDWDVSATIKAAAEAMRDPRVTYFPVTTWTDVSAGDGTHPDAAGYVAEGAHLATVLSAYLPAAWIVPKGTRPRPAQGSTFDWSSAGWFDVLMERAGLFDRDLVVLGVASTLLALSRDEFADTGSASMSALVGLSLTRTEFGDTRSAAAAAALALNVSRAEFADTISAASGSPALSLQLACSEQSDTSNASAGAIATLVLSRTEVADVISAVSAATATLQLARSEFPDALSATAAALLALQLAQTERADAVSAVLAAIVGLQLARAEGADAQQAAASAIATLQFSRAEVSDMPAGALSAVISLAATLAEVRDGDSAAAQAAIALSASIREFADALSAQSGSQSTFSLGATETADTASAAASAALLASLTRTEVADGVAAIAAALVTLAAQAFEQSDTDAATLAQNQDVMGAVANEQPDVASGTSAAALALAGAINEATDTASITAALALSARLVAVEAGDTPTAALAAALALFLGITESPDTLRAAATLNVGGLSAQHAAWLEALARERGLIDVLTVSPALRSDGTLVQDISEAGAAVTVTTTAAPVGQPGASALTPTQAAWLEALVRHIGVIDPLTVTDSTIGDGTLLQSVQNDGTTTTVTRLQ
jgi:hypothetical protein